MTQHRYTYLGPVKKHGTIVDWHYHDEVRALNVDDALLNLASQWIYKYGSHEHASDIQMDRKYLTKE